MASKYEYLAKVTEQMKLAEARLEKIQKAIPEWMNYRQRYQNDLDELRSLLRKAQSDQYEIVEESQLATPTANK